MPEVHGSLSVSLLAVLGAAAGSFLIAFFSYRTTVPPVSPAMRWSLTALRSVGLFLLLLLLGEPLISLRYHHSDPPGVLVLIDNSKSMTLRDRSGDRAAALRSVVASPMFHRLEEKADVRAAVFDRSARGIASRSPDSISLDGSVTDLAAALRYARTSTASSNIRAVVLVSDGVATEGSNPRYEAEEMGVPIFTVGIGDTVEQRDVSVRRVQTNEIAYVGNKLPVHALVHSSGFNGERAEVTVRLGTRVLERAMVSLGAASQDAPVEFNVVPSAEGRQVLSVEVSSLPGELTEKNNRSDISVLVLRSKMNVIAICGGPSPDAAFIRRTLEADQNVTLRPFTETAGGAFQEGPLTGDVLGQSDCIVLIGYPRAGSDPSVINAIGQAAEAGRPVFILLGRTVDPSALGALATVLPFTVRDVQTAELQVFASVPESKRLHALLRTASADIWGKLPPVFRWQSGFSAKPESEVLALVRYQNTVFGDPLILVRNVNGRKSLAVTAYGLWRWKMLGDASAGTDRVFDTFVGNAVRWLTTREDQRPIRVQPVRPTFTAAEPVEFAGDTFDESFRPIEDAGVTVVVRGGGKSVETTLVPLGNGQYAGSMEPLPPGEYTTAAAVTVSGKMVGTDSGSFSVRAMTVEFLETRMNKLLLQQIAARTGGRYVDAASVESLEPAIRSAPGFEPQDRVRTSEVQLWNVGWMMGTVIAVFAAEWALRKRQGMM